MFIVGVGGTGQQIVRNERMRKMSMIVKDITRVINIKESIIRRRVECHRAKGKDGFIKRDMEGNDNYLGVMIKTTVTLMIGRITEKDAQN